VEIPKPQDGSLSPLLSNILLTDLDRELDRRGDTFCQDADDCNIYVRTRATGARVMINLTRSLKEKLKLTVNTANSAVARPWERKFLGYSMTWHKVPRLKDCSGKRQKPSGQCSSNPERSKRAKRIQNH
jgi:RNA-directed DNA polymerase